MKEPSIYEQFAESLYQESPRGWAELLSMQYGIMARTGLNEPEALELATKIVATNKQTKGETNMSDDIFDGIDPELKAKIEQSIRATVDAHNAAKAQEAQAPLIAELAKLQKFPSKNAARIAAIVKQLGWDTETGGMGYLR